MKERLNQRQQKFAEFMASSGNQTESAIMAGYSPKRAHVTGSELVRNRNVSEEKGNYSAARGCLDSLSKLMEWFPKEEKKSHENRFGIELMLKKIEEEQKRK